MRAGMQIRILEVPDRRRSPSYLAALREGQVVRLAALRRLGVVTIAFVAVGLAVSTHATPDLSAQADLQRQGVVTLAATSPEVVNHWAPAIDQMQRDGSLMLRRVQQDAMLPGRLHERFTQIYKGVPVFGDEVVRETENGVPISLFGRLRANIDLDVNPALSESDALRIAGEAAHGTASRADLVILPMNDEACVLCYRTQIFTGSQLLVTFVDANNGTVVMQYDNLQRQSAVGLGTGVWGDSKKISTTAMSGGFVTEDRLRPALILTYDLLGNRAKVDSFLEGLTLLAPPDLASRPDNAWTDGAVVDAHVYGGWVYDYYWKRFNRQGLDDNNQSIVSLVHPVRRETATQESIYDPYYANAFYDPACQCIVYGDGVSSSALGPGAEVKPFSAALDIVAHELTHAVTDASSGLIYRNESGALNEAFSDIMGTSVEFFYQPAGSGPLKADYTIGEDLLMNMRSLSNPSQYGNPDHYSNRFGIGMQWDNGGVHTNSTIAGHAFYLAIEGGTNRTSRLTVSGVGPANREQIEKIFYRAFVYQLPPYASFYMARVATTHAAIDLYGVGSPAESAVTQAWDAVGVRLPGAGLTTTFSPDPAPVLRSSASFGALYTASLVASVSEFQGVGFTVTDYAAVVADSAGNILNLSTGTGDDFAGLFGDCGARSAHIPANGRVCGQVRVELGGDDSALLLFEFNGIDDNGNLGKFYSNVLGLGGQSPATGASRPAAAAQRNLLQALATQDQKRPR